MRKIIDLSTWERRDHYHLFSDNHPHPTGTLTVQLDLTQAKIQTKKLGCSLFHYYSFHSLQALNAWENFRYRQENNEVVLYDVVDFSCTVARSDHSFGYARVPYTSCLETFCKTAQKAFDRCQQEQGIVQTVKSTKDTLFYTITPTIHFTGLQFTPSNPICDIPCLAFGQFLPKEGKLIMPHAIQYHHGFIDGYYIGEYLKELQERLNTST